MRTSQLLPEGLADCRGPLGRRRPKLSSNVVSVGGSEADPTRGQSESMVTGFEWPAARARNAGVHAAATRLRHLPAAQVVAQVWRELWRKF